MASQRPWCSSRRVAEPAPAIPLKRRKTMLLGGEGRKTKRPEQPKPKSPPSITCRRIVCEQCLEHNVITEQASSLFYSTIKNTQSNHLKTSCYGLSMLFDPQLSSTLSLCLVCCLARSANKITMLLTPSYPRGSLPPCLLFHLL